jgi:hypothetical protein
MCHALPLALAGFAINSGSALLSHSSASETAKTQNLSNAIARQNAAADFARQDAALGRRQAQEQDAASARKADVALDVQRTVATNTVAAGEAGIAGPTVDTLMHDIYAQQGRFDTRTDTNLDWTQGQLQDQKVAASYQMRDRINGLRDVRRPSLAATGLKIGTAGLDAASSYKANAKLWGES